MKQLIGHAFRYRLKKACGILVPAPQSLRDENIDFLLIGEDGVEYHLLGNPKTFQMWNLVDTKVHISGWQKSHDGPCMKISTLTYKCVDDFIDTDNLPVNQLDEIDFQLSNLDYAI